MPGMSEVTSLKMEQFTKKLCDENNDRVVGLIM